MKDYDVVGLILKGKKAVIAAVLPVATRNNVYYIYDVYNISDGQENKIVIHFKDLIGKKLSANGNYESFIIDLSKDKYLSINFAKKIRAAFHHENGELTKTPEEIFDAAFDPIVTPDTTGKGTIREGEEDGE
ncbi:hypothetical protein SAMN06265349_10219 [Flavobacterium resistens]|uniref:Uncharacterized protein n=1 Tax=Flavobacterium resistens TaxID=443612 RepID=A0A521BY05_9FLAO|nr:hypothetical protein [Flavobacterium resistens]MRX70455.1 hypothetical protein [Flavobacterium resistens]SMO52056.1 hypothetical protein SAMN06265349_10219 [Flavobacterium resistens]